MALQLKLLITGANGYIGQALVARTLNAGHSVSTLTRRPFDVEATKNFVAQYKEEELLLPLAGQDVVVHLAAKAHQSKSNSDAVRSDYYQVNVENTLALARAALSAGVKRFIFVSSIKVNGECTRGRPFRAEDIPAPEDIYGQTKWQAEQELRNLLNGTATELVIVRPPLVWGGELKGNLKLLARLIRWHIPLPFASVNNRRSLVSLDNLCNLLVACLTVPDLNMQVLLVSDGVARTTAQITQLLGESIGIKPWLVSCPAWVFKLIRCLPGGESVVAKLVSDLELDISATSRLTGWEAVPVGGSRLDVSR